MTLAGELAASVRERFGVERRPRAGAGRTYVENRSDGADFAG
jgi:hypothetical protein